ncbi:hypothetical protein IT774_12845 [Salinimonas marina]|uniref:KfrA N-terminal DNA-binding domain-containing protein n=1 Tax=Salinimonas marina TaxID=2785918 RepID=A0A7S9DW24_9ALTE|nr:hypothetical protein [Salinimonas marina]QPG05022.1 hypothetical protein IT774_12845 [Salinimonas marina]
MSNVSANDLLTLCNKLKQEGQQPTVALLRSRAPGKVGVAQAINIIRQFKHRHPAPTAATNQTSATTTATLEQRVTELEAAVAVLEKRLAALTPEGGAQAVE